LGKKNLEPGVNQRLTIGFRPGYLEPKLKPGLISRTGTKNQNWNFLLSTTRPELDPGFIMFP